MCRFCEQYDFGKASCEIDKYGANVIRAGGSFRFPKEGQFNYCPVCGKSLRGEQDGSMARLLTLDEAIFIGQISCWYQIRSGEVWLAQVTPTINGNISISRLRQKDCIEEKQGYGKRWVCWSDQPTKEQRKAVKWE